MNKSRLSIVDVETGELHGKYKHKMKLSDSDFVLFFAKNLATLAVSKPSSKNRIVAAILNEMNKDNVVHLVSSFTIPLAKQLEVSKSYITKVIIELIELRILFRIGRGVYIVNPWIYGKGNLQNISKLRWQFDAVRKGNEVEVEWKITKTYAGQPGL